MSKFSCFFGQPTNKTVTRTAYTWGLLIANHLDRPIRNTEPQSGPIYYTLFWRCTPLLRLLPCTASCAEKVTSWARLTHFDISPINFTVWSHVLCTGGDALSTDWYYDQRIIVLVGTVEEKYFLVCVWNIQT